MDWLIAIKKPTIKDLDGWFNKLDQVDGIYLGRLSYQRQGSGRVCLISGYISQSRLPGAGTGEA